MDGGMETKKEAKSPISRLLRPAGPDRNTLARRNAMPAPEIQNQTIVVRDLSNREFLERHAQAGRVGLSGGVTLVDKVICRAERHLDEQERWGAWSHAFIFEGVRADGHHRSEEHTSELQSHSFI